MFNQINEQNTYLLMLILEMFYSYFCGNFHIQNPNLVPVITPLFEVMYCFIRFYVFFIFYIQKLLLKGDENGNEVLELDNEEYENGNEVLELENNQEKEYENNQEEEENKQDIINSIENNKKDPFFLKKEIKLLRKQVEECEWLQSCFEEDGYKFSSGYKNLKKGNRLYKERRNLLRDIDESEWYQSCF